MARVTGKLIRANLAPFVGPVAFVSLSTPLLVDEDLVSTTVILACTNKDGDLEGPDGELGVVLAVGDYRLSWRVSNRDTAVIVAVPAGDVTVQLSSIITDDLTYTLAANPLYILGNRPNSGWRWLADTPYPELFNQTTGLWHQQFPIGAAGSVKTAWSDGRA